MTVVDAVNLEKNLAQSNEAMEQVAFSDIVLINKMDLVSAEQMAAVERRVRQLNAMARIYHTVNSEIALASILGVGAFDLVQKLEVDPEFLGDHEHEHDPAIGSFVLTERSPVDVNRLMTWMGGMAEAPGRRPIPHQGHLPCERVSGAPGVPERADADDPSPGPAVGARRGEDDAVRRHREELGPGGVRGRPRKLRVPVSPHPITGATE